MFFNKTKKFSRWRHQNECLSQFSGKKNKKVTHEKAYNLKLWFYHFYRKMKSPWKYLINFDEKTGFKFELKNFAAASEHVITGKSIKNAK